MTEFIECGDLESFILGGDAYPWGIRISMACDIAAGMSYLHQCDIIHRDLNTNNCLVKKDNSVVVADFGLARWSRSTKTNRSRLNSCVGSAYSSAPEMLNQLNRSGYDNRIDIFSFGIILIQIISRISSDPDYLPRTQSFGFDVYQFITKYPDIFQYCPDYIFAIAVKSSSLQPCDRPSFIQIHDWLKSILEIEFFQSFKVNHNPLTVIVMIYYRK